MQKCQPTPATESIERSPVAAEAMAPLKQRSSCDRSDLSDPFKFELGQSVLLHSLAHSAMSLLIGDYARHFIVSSSASVCSHSVIFSREQVAWIAIPRMDAVVPALISNQRATTATICGPLWRLNIGTANSHFHLWTNGWVAEGLSNLNWARVCCCIHLHTRQCPY